MVPQARSEATRQKILNAGIDLFTEVGYAAAGLGEIIERVEMTKGALYHHFDSKDALATAIIEQGTNLTLDAFRNLCESSSPALENMIHGVFVVTDLLVSDKTARTAEQLTRGLAEFNSAASHVWNSRLDAITTQAKRAIAEGDLREDSDPYVVSESVLNAMLGAQLLAKTADGKRSQQATNPIPGTSSPSNRRQHVTGLLPRVSCPRVPTPSPRPPHRLTDAYQPRSRSSTHSCSVKFSNVTNTTGSSERISADLLILARTVQPSQCCSSTTRFASASTPESAPTTAGTVWKISGNASPANPSGR
jgi:AcrR family transcriptional regulator